MNILILTDTKKHSNQNSLYAIIKEMSAHQDIGNILVADRDQLLNQRFFNGIDFTALHGILADVNFDWSNSKERLQQELRLVDLDQIDLIFMRLPRPLSDEYLMSLKEHFDLPFINDPLGMIKTSSKAFLLNITAYCPPMRLCKSQNEITEFSQNYPIVLKPLKDYGGKGVVKISDGQVDLGDKQLSIKDYFNTIDQQLQSEGYLAMKYLKNVTNGDKRLLVVDGEILASSLRMPANGSWICNASRGGRSVASEPSSHEIAMISKINHLLKANGIFIYGVDTLEDDNGQRIISEINTMSIGGWPQAQQQTEKPIIKIMLNKMIENVRNNNKN